MDALMLIQASDQDASSPVNKTRSDKKNGSFKNLFASLAAPGSTSKLEASVVEGHRFLSKVAPNSSGNKECDLAGDLFAVSIPLLVDYLESYTNQGGDHISSEFKDDLNSLITKLKEITTDTFSQKDFGSIISKYSDMDVRNSGETISVIPLSKGQQGITLPELGPVEKLTLIKDVIDGFIDTNQDMPKELTHALKTVSRIITQNVHFDSIKESLPDVSSAIQKGENENYLDIRNSEQKREPKEPSDNHSVSWKDITVSLPYNASVETGVKSVAVTETSVISNAEISTVKEMASNSLKVSNRNKDISLSETFLKTEQGNNVGFFSDEINSNSQAFSEGIVNLDSKSQGDIDSVASSIEESLIQFKYADLAEESQIDHTSDDQINTPTTKTQIKSSGVVGTSAFSREVKNNEINSKSQVLDNKAEASSVEIHSSKESNVSDIDKIVDATSAFDRNTNIKSNSRADINMTVDKSTSSDVNPLINKVRVAGADNLSLDQFSQKLSDIVKANNEPAQDTELKTEVSELNTFLRNEIRKSVKKVVMEHISQKKAEASPKGEPTMATIEQQSRKALGSNAAIQPELIINKENLNQSQPMPRSGSESSIDFSAELEKVFSPTGPVSADDSLLVVDDVATEVSTKNSSLFKKVDIIKRNNSEHSVISQVENKDFDTRINTVKEPVSIYKGQQQIVDQVKDALRIKLNLVDNEVRIRLNPKELGAVSIKLKMVSDTADASKQSVNVSFTVENESVKDALLSSVSTLKASLEQNNGLDIKDFTVFVRDDGNFDGQNRDQSNLHAAKKKKKFSVSDLDEDVDEVDSITGEQKVTGQIEYQA